MPNVCNDHCYWWDGELEAWCELISGHDGDHTDGATWWDDNGDDRGVHHP